mgnify:CR=1 FL=1
MHIPQNCEPYFAEMGTVLRRTANRIAQKREPYFEETGTVLRRNTNRIAKKRERYSAETGTVFQRKGNSIPTNGERYYEETGTVFRRTANRIAKKREQCSEEILSKEKGDAKGAQIKTTGYNVCAERNLQKGHTLIISSAQPSNGAESAKFNQTKAGKAGKKQYDSAVYRKYANFAQTENSTA